VLAFACFAIAGILAVQGSLTLAGVLSLASGRYVLGEYSTMGPPIFLVVAVVLAVLGVGLMRGWRFARRLAIIAAALFLATSALPLSAAVGYMQVGASVIHGAKIILAIVGIRYLLQPEMVEFFSAKRG